MQALDSTTLNLLGLPQTCTDLSHFGTLVAWIMELQQLLPARLNYAEIARVEAECLRILPNSIALKDHIDDLFAISYQTRAEHVDSQITAMTENWRDLLQEACILYQAADNPTASDDLCYRVFQGSQKQRSLDLDELELGLDTKSRAREYMQKTGSTSTAPSLIPRDIPRAPSLPDPRWNEICSRAVSVEKQLYRPPKPIQLYTALALLVDKSTSSTGKQLIKDWFRTEFNWDANIESNEWNHHRLWYLELGHGLFLLLPLELRRLSTHPKLRQRTTTNLTNTFFN
jgi:hypothetical protein